MPSKKNLKIHLANAAGSAVCKTPGALTLERGKVTCKTCMRVARITNEEIAAAEKAAAL